jgi:hypothetical protein
LYDRRDRRDGFALVLLTGAAVVGSAKSANQVLDGAPLRAHLLLHGPTQDAIRDI